MVDNPRWWFVDFVTISAQVHYCNKNEGINLLLYATFAKLYLDSTEYGGSAKSGFLQ